MGLFRFRRNDAPPTPMRCTYCSMEVVFSGWKIHRLEKLNKKDPICPVKEPCQNCIVGDMIPVDYIDEKGNIYLFDDIKKQIKPPGQKNN